MTSKTWRVVVTPLTTTSPLHELEVAAANWMGALREARREMGEDGGVPTGASCSVAPDGTATIVDSDARRKFVLTPGGPAPVRSSSAPGEREPIGNGQMKKPVDKKRGETLGYGEAAAGAQSKELAGKPDLELLFTRDEEPAADNPLTYRERAYLIPRGLSVSEAEARLRFVLADLQRELNRVLRGKLVNLAAFDHRWVDQPLRPPLVVLEWRDWRGEPVVDYPAAEHRSKPAPARVHAEPDDRLASVFEALHELPHLATPHEAVGFIVNLLETTVPSAAISGCLYDINTDELRFVASTGPGAEEQRGTALRRNQGLFGRAARAENTALVIHDMHEAEDFDPQTDGRPGLTVENLLLRPVVHDGRLLGMLQFINRTSGAFSAPDVHLVNYAADRLGEFLNSARTRARN